MSGRYAFSLPGPQPRDGWFRVGSIDVTTTLLVTILGAASMVLYAISPDIVAKGVFVPELVRHGQVWRLVLWPLVNLPGIWELLGLVVFWYFGRFVEDEIGRVPQAWLLLAMTVLPAAVLTAVNVANDPSTFEMTRWTTSSFSVSLLGLGMLCIFCATHPYAPFFFNIHAWIIAVALVAMNVLQIVAARGWADLLLLFLVIAVGVFGARQRGMVDELEFIPRLSFLSGAPRGKGTRHRAGARKRSKEPGTVVTGPWSPPGGGGVTPLEHAELDSLLDIIAEKGLDALSPAERRRLDELRRRLSDS